MVAATPNSGKRRHQSGRRGVTPDRSSIVLAISICAVGSGIGELQQNPRQALLGGIDQQVGKVLLVAGMLPREIGRVYLGEVRFLTQQAGGG